MTEFLFKGRDKAPFDALIVPVCGDGRVLASPAIVFAELASLIDHLKETCDFAAKAGEVAIHVLPPKSIAKRIVLLGIGEIGAKALTHEETGGKLAAALMGAKITRAHVALDAAGTHTAELAAAIANGVALRGYRFDRYKTKKDADKNPPIEQLVFLCGEHDAAARDAHANLSDITAGVLLARDLVTMPPNELYPETFAAQAKECADKYGFGCTIFGKKDLKKMGAGAFYAVGQASDFEPRMVVLEYKPKRPANAKPIALVGKGITFDSGGLCIKPGPSMSEMKADMAGAAAVLGTMVALARLKANCHVVAALALAENSISDEAYRPSDVIHTLSGQTVEVLNTDAEGRLVLCDTMTHVQRTYKPSTIVDIATLTGASVMAFGDVFSGVFSTSDKMVHELDAAAQECGELVWRMPLHDAYTKDIKSEIADLKNIGTVGKAGASTAAAFLQQFVEDGIEWAHIDMAPMMMSAKDKPLSPKGASGYGVRLLTYWLTMSRGA